MGSSDEYYVDLEALDTVGRKLNGVLRSMTEAKSKAGHSTFLPAGTLVPVSGRRRNSGGRMTK